MQTDLAEIERLDSLQSKIRECIERASPTLSWFAQQVVHRGRIPQNIWLHLDRPLPKESKTFGLAFDVWHAILRAERTLRLAAPETAKALRLAADPLRERLQEFASVRRAAPHTEPPEVYARRLVSDEIYGTFNALSAASVLRSEVFNERSAPTPSYLAGHILLSELKVAQSQARAHSVKGIRDRAPRLYAVAQGVHSLMLYVEHLRRRSALFERLAGEIDDFGRVRCVMEAVERGPNQVPLVWDGYLRLAMTRWASICGDCASLLLSTRPFFEAWQTGLQKRASSHELLTVNDAATELKSAVQVLAGSDVAAIQAAQQASFEYSVQFCNRLSVEIGNVYLALRSLFSLGPGDGYTRLLASLNTLRGALSALEGTHLGGSKPAEYPSIRDAARFQFAKMLVRQFLDDHDTFRPADEALADSLTIMTRAYNLSVTRGVNLEHFACQAIRVLGASWVGRSVQEWWRNYDECFSCPSWASYDSTNPDAWSGEKFVWMSTRHSSFETVVTLTTAVRECQDLDELSEPLHMAAAKVRAIAEKIEVTVKELTQWCSSRGHQLVLAGQNGMFVSADALELAAALSIADRIGEPWNERLETEAFEVIKKLQHSDGSFGAVAPLYHNRGFAFYLPSSSVIALLARFVTRGTGAPWSPEHRDRLLRWEPVLVESARFLVTTIVGGNRHNDTDHVMREWIGWHSDRHPETERIDCFATTEAVTALCRLDDALRWLINLRVAGHFGVSWPSRVWQTTIPTDCEARDQQLLLRVAPLVRRLRLSSELYSATSRSTVENTWSHTFFFHGPPGTGKTYSQRVIAGELGWPVVTLTIGDFLNDGEDKLVRRAAEIFRRLSYLSNVCIVFDEFDEMVTSRSRKGEQGWSGLRLLTAAMLPLLSGLRDDARRRCCSVSFTTNLIENIDRAATRGGRVDEAKLLTYPDYTSRLLLGVMTAARNRRSSDEINRDQLRALAMDTALCTQQDAQNYIERKLGAIVTATVPKPIPPIDWLYYGSPDNLKEEAVLGLRNLFESIGSTDVQVEWLSDSENTNWKPVYEAVHPRGMAEKRRSWRRETSGISCLVDNQLATLIDFSDGGFRVRLSSPVGDSFEVFFSSHQVSLTASKVYAELPPPGGEILVGAIVSSRHASDWQRLTKRLL